ncbi:MAG: RNA polymerase sigma factor [Bacteroidota bacterium]
MSSESIKDRSDESLVKAIVQTGNTLYFDIIYQRYAQKVYYQIISYLKDPEEAQDLMHDIFVKLYEKLGRFEGKSSFSTWLFSFTRNSTLDYLRKKGRMPRQEWDDHLAESIPEVSDNELLSIQTERLGRILDQIHPDEKAVLIMMYAHEWKMEEIADHMGISLSAVKMRIKRSKAKVKKLFDEMEEKSRKKTK